MAIAPLALAPPPVADNAFNFGPLGKLGQIGQPDATLAALSRIYGNQPTAAPSAAPAPPQGGGNNYGKAIAGIESGGRYDLLGPVIPSSGDRAYGKYQIMGANVPEWTRAALGTAMTPDQFLKDTDAQEKTFQHRFGQYVDKYGPDGAARAWFAGEGGMNNPNAKDLYGTTVSDYSRRFNAGLGGQNGN